MGFINETFPTSTGAGGSTGNDAGIQPWVNQDMIIWQTGGGIFPNQFYTYDHENGEKTNPITKKTKTADPIKMATMYLNLTGAGFAILCEDQEYAETDIDSSSLLFFESDPVTGDFYQPNATNYTLYHQQVYGVDFSVHRSDSSVSDAPDAWKNNTDYIVMNILSSWADDTPLGNGSSTCPGIIYTQTCRLRPAKVDYPVQLTQRGEESDWIAVLATDQEHESTPYDTFYEYNKTSGLQQNYHAVKDYQNITDTANSAQTLGLELGNNTLSGLAAGLNSYLGGYASISRAPSGLGFVLNTTGSAQSYLYGPPSLQSSACDYQYAYPLTGGGNLLGNYTSHLGPANGTTKSRFVDPGIIGNINSIMFALATDVSFMDPFNTYDQSYSGLTQESGLILSTTSPTSGTWAVQSPQPSSASSASFLAIGDSGSSVEKSHWDLSRSLRLFVHLI